MADGEIRVSWKMAGGEVTYTDRAYAWEAPHIVGARRSEALRLARVLRDAGYEVTVTEPVPAREVAF